MTSAMTSCGDQLNSTPAEIKVEPFGLSLWYQRRTDPKSEMTRRIEKRLGQVRSRSRSGL